MNSRSARHHAFAVRGRAAGGGPSRAHLAGSAAPRKVRRYALLPCTDPDEVAKAAAREVRVENLLVEADHAGMNAVAELAAAGSLRAHIEAVFPLADAAGAHALGETGRTTGKILLTVSWAPVRSALERLAPAPAVSGRRG